MLSDSVVVPPGYDTTVHDADQEEEEDQVGCDESHTEARLKWLVYGARGWIGGQFVSLVQRMRPWDVIQCGNARVDDTQELANELLQANPDRVVSFIGRTCGPNISNIDYLEQSHETLRENVRDNLFAPVMLARYCKELRIHFTYLGTGCIFEYASNHPAPFLETDHPNFFGSAYSVIKGFTDEFFCNMFSQSALNVRIRMPITAKKHARNFITKIVSYSSIHSVPNSMTVLDDLLPVLMDMIVLKRTGTVNLVNPGVITHQRILELYKQHVDRTHTWTLVDAAQLHQQGSIQARRSNNALDTSTISRDYPYVMPIEQSIIRVLQNYK